LGTEAESGKTKKGGRGVLYFFKQIQLYYFILLGSILVLYNTVRGKKQNIVFCFVLVAS